MNAAERAAEVLRDPRSHRGGPSATPRLAVTRQQAEQMICVPKNGQYYSADEWVLPESLTLRLPERPTMPCDRGGCALFGDPLVFCGACIGNGSVPIPEGTRVRIECPCPDCNGTRASKPKGVAVVSEPCRTCRCEGSVPASYATLAEVRGFYDENDQWFQVVLSDIEPAGEEP